MINLQIYKCTSIKSKDNIFTLKKRSTERLKKNQSKKKFHRIFHLFWVAINYSIMAHPNESRNDWTLRKLRNRLVSMFHGTVKRARGQEEGRKEGKKASSTTSTLVKRLWNRWTWSTFPSIARKTRSKTRRSPSRGSEVEKFHWMERNFSPALVSHPFEFETRHSPYLRIDNSANLHAELRKIRVELLLNYIFRLLNSIP